MRTNKPSESGTLLFVGRLEQAKGIDLLCEAWYESNRQLQLTVIGDGPQGEHLRFTYPDVEWMGQTHPLDVRESMQRARALVFPSIWEETFGNVVAEAMACGLPVATSSIAPISHYVRDASEEWVFDVHNPDSFQ